MIPKLDEEQVLCQLEDIPDGKARGFLPVRRDDRVFAVRHGNDVYVYLNACPHEWIPMDFARDRFLSANDSEIMCYAHGAHFNITSGICTAGPCLHKQLIRVPHRIEANAILIPLILPRIPGTSTARTTLE